MTVSSRGRRDFRGLVVAVVAVLVLTACDPVYTMAAVDHVMAEASTTRTTSGV